MKEYELTVLLHPDLEIDLEKPLKKVRGIITDNGGEIIKEESQGKRRLAYPIVKQNFAVYVNFDLKLPPASAAKIDSVLNITDEVIRHLLVTVDAKEKAYLADSKNRREERQEEEE